MAFTQSFNIGDNSLLDIENLEKKLTVVDERTVTNAGHNLEFIKESPVNNHMNSRSFNTFNKSKILPYNENTHQKPDSTKKQRTFYKRKSESDNSFKEESYTEFFLSELKFLTPEINSVSEISSSNQFNRNNVKENETGFEFLNLTNDMEIDNLNNAISVEDLKDILKLNTQESTDDANIWGDSIQFSLITNSNIPNEIEDDHNVLDDSSFICPVRNSFEAEHLKTILNLSRHELLQADEVMRDQSSIGCTSIAAQKLNQSFNGISYYNQFQEANNIPENDNSHISKLNFSGIKSNVCDTSQGLSYEFINKSFNEQGAFNLLAEWNLPSIILDQYRKKGVVKMFDWQLECLMNYKVTFEHSNLVYSAPTSAGKTLVSEILMLKTVLERNKKVLVILPFISVVREKMQYLQDLLSESGYRVEGFFGGYTPPGGFDKINIAICTIEKANSIVNKLLEQGKLDEIGTIVVDEVHLISDPNRGYILELLLAKVLYMSKKFSLNIQVITMSATLANIQLLKHWLNAQLYVTDFRPVELKEMIKIENNIYNAKMEFIRDVTQPENAEILECIKSVVPNDSDHIVQLCIETIMEACSVIVFCPSKDWCEKLTLQLASSIRKVLKLDDECVEKLRSQINTEALNDVKSRLQDIPTGLDHELKKTITYGCAFHHAGLTMEERDIVEASFKAGALKVIVATSTLSSGVNLPARRVIIRTPLFGGKAMNSLTYKQMIGRAGRTGKDVLGESILICSANNVRIGRELIESELQPITSCLQIDNSTHLKRALLEVISSNVASTKSDLNSFISCTLLSAERQLNCINSNPSEMDLISGDDTFVNSALEFLMEYEFVRVQHNDETNEDHYVATRLGQACLASSMPPTDGLILFSELQKSHRCFVLESELHAVYLVTPYSVCHQLRDIDWMFFLDLWEKLSPAMKKVGELVGVKESFIIRAVRGQTKLDYNLLQIHKRFYTALALLELVNETPINVVASKYKCTRGMLQGLQQMSSTFAGIVTAFCNSLQWTTLSLIVSQFKERLFFGIHSDLIDLMRLPDISHKLARVLFDGGITSLVDLANSDTFIVEKLLFNTLSFDSAKQQDNENSFEMIKRNEARLFFLTGKDGVSIPVASKLLVQEARQFIQYDMGVENIMWSDNKSNVYVEACNISCAQLENNSTYIPSTVRANKKSTLFVENDICVQQNDVMTARHCSKNPNDQNIEIEAMSYKNYTFVQYDNRESNSVFKDENSFNVNVKNTEIMSNNRHKNDQIHNNQPPTYLQYDTCEPNHLYNDKNSYNPNIQNEEVMPIKPYENDDNPNRNSKIFAEHNVYEPNHFFNDENSYNPNIQTTQVISNNVQNTYHCLNNESLTFLQYDTCKPNDFIVVENSYNPDIQNVEVILNKPYENANKETEIFGTNNTFETNVIINDENAYNHDMQKEDPMSIEQHENEYILKKESTIVVEYNSHDLNEIESNPDVKQKDVANESIFDTSFHNNNNMNMKIIKPDLEKYRNFVASSEEGNKCPIIKKTQEDNGMHPPFYDSRLLSTSITMNLDYLKAEESRNLEIDNLFDSIMNSQLLDKSTSEILNSQNIRDDKQSVYDDNNYSSEFKKTHEYCGLSSGHSLMDMLKLSPETSICSDPNELNNLKINSNDFSDISIFDISSNPNLFDTAVDKLMSKSYIGFSLGLELLERNGNLEIGSKLNHNQDVQNSFKLYEIDNQYYIAGIAFSIEKDVYYLNMQKQMSCKGVSIYDKCLFLQTLLQSKDKTLQIFDSKLQLKTLLMTLSGTLSTGMRITTNIEDPNIANWLLYPDQRMTFIQTINKFTPNYSYLIKTENEENSSFTSYGFHANNNISAKIRCCVEASIISTVLQEQMKLMKAGGSEYLYKFFKEIEMPLQLSLCHMEILGFPVNKEGLLTFIGFLSTTLKKIENRIYDLNRQRFDLNSPQEVARVLGIHRKHNKYVRTSKQILEKIDTPISSLILNYRKLTYILSNNVRPIYYKTEKNRVHPHSITFTTSGRIFMAEPNLQSVAKEFSISLFDNTDKYVYVCPRRNFSTSGNRCLLSLDYCQLEMRILAHLSQDPILQEVMISNQDIFKSIAARWNKIDLKHVSEEMRNSTKQICYGIIYGMGLKSLANALKCTENEAKLISEQFHHAYPGIKLYINKIITFARKNSYVETITHRRRYLENMNSTIASKRNLAERQAVNSAIQGSAADIAKMAIIRIEKNILKYRYKLGIPQDSARLVMHLHDELIFEVDELKAKKVSTVLRASMEQCCSLSVPLKVKVKMGRNWANLKEI